MIATRTVATRSGDWLRGSAGSLHRVYFAVRCTTEGEWTIVHVVGEIDLATAPRYRAELVRAAAESDAVAVDLTDCDLIDSVGLGVTLGGARRMRRKEGRFAVVAGGSAAATLTDTGLDEVLRVVASVGSLQDEP